MITVLVSAEVGSFISEVFESIRGEEVADGMKAGHCFFFGAQRTAKLRSGFDYFPGPQCHVRFAAQNSLTLRESHVASAPFFHPSRTLGVGEQFLELGGLKHVCKRSAG